MWHVGVFLQNYGCFLFSVFAIWIVGVLGCWAVIRSVTLEFYFACGLVCILEDVLWETSDLRNEVQCGVSGWEEICSEV